jgi:adenylate kinase family enzyme
VIGSSGSGKTTVATELAHTLGCPHIELDGIYHQRGWTPLENGEFGQVVSLLTEPAAWVVDGNYSAVRDIVWQRADTVVFLDLPLTVVLARLVPRTVRRVLGRTMLWNGNREPLSNLWSWRPEQSVIVWAVAHHEVIRARYTEAIAHPRWSSLTFIRLCTSSQVDQFRQYARDTAEREGASQWISN